MRLDEVRELIDHQAAVVSRRQLLEAGATNSDLRRWLRRRELVQFHPGVYIAHTGPPSWLARAWAAVQLHWPAALTHSSAVSPGGDPIHVAVSPARKPARRDGIVVHRLQDLDDRVRWHVAPPRLRLEDALLLQAGHADRASAVALLQDACRRRWTTPDRLVTELDHRPRAPHRSLLTEVLRETGVGVHSLLERGYAHRVERAHRLPRGRRQAREETAIGVVYRDVLYEEQGIVVELDGRVGHELSRDRWRDMQRDLVAAGTGLLTLRIGWWQVERQPCQTAARVAEVLRLRGWPGRAQSCGQGCRIDVRIGATR